MSITPTIPWEQYQKLPPSARSRPLTDEEYSRLTPSQLQAGGLAEKDEGAPADFTGRVFPNPDHIQPYADADAAIAPTRLPQGVSFQRENWHGEFPGDISNPAAADVQPAMGREVGAKMSTQPASPKMALPPGATLESAPQQSDAGMKLPPGAILDAPAGEKKEEPGFLDKEIPLDSYPHATESGLQSIGRGVRSAVQGLGATLDPRAHGADEEAMVGADERSRIALPVYRTLRGLGQTGQQATQLPAAIHDINASPDPLSHYGKAAQDTAGEGAGQALTALATEGAGRVLGAGVEAAAKPGATLNRVARTGGKLVGDVAEDIPGVRALGKVKKNWEATAPKLPAEVTQARGLQTGGKAAVEPSAALGRIATPEATPDAIPRELPRDLDATTENRPFAGEPAPRIAKPLDATGENRPFAGGMDEYPGPSKAKPAAAETKLRNSGTIPSPSETAQNIRAYRARSIGEEGIPYRAESHAQASASQPEAEAYLEHRAETERTPQELIGVDLSQSPAFSAEPGPRGPTWYKFHGDVPESAVSRIARPGEVSARPIGGATPAAAPADPLLTRLRERASGIQEQAQVPGENEDLTDVLTRSRDQARASRGLPPL